MAISVGDIQARGDVAIAEGDVVIQKSGPIPEINEDTLKHTLADQQAQITKSLAEIQKELRQGQPDIQKLKKAVTTVREIAPVVAKTFISPFAGLLEGAGLVFEWLSKRPDSGESKGP